GFYKAKITFDISIMERLIKSIILLGFGVFLFSRLVNGSIYFYINQRFVILTLLAASGFVLVGASYFLRRPSHSHADNDDHDHAEHNHAEHDHHDHDHEEVHYDHHDHDHSHLSWFGVVVILLPLILGWLVPPKPLGASAFSNREINVGSLQSVAPPGSNDRMGLISGEKNILDWLVDIQNSASPEALNSQEAHVIGFVYRDERFDASQFLIGRFVVSCCVADASPVGLVVEGENAADFTDDQWVEIHGHFETKLFEGEETPILMIDDIVAIDPPSEPYLYG
ncbi:MAG: TIGR03943 family protein, partial [Candidatus Promineifilaceae bacterium]